MLKVGDLVESHKGLKGLVLDTEKLYPTHPQSPLRGVFVHWLEDTPSWARDGLVVSVFSVKRVAADGR